MKDTRHAHCGVKKIADKLIATRRELAQVAAHHPRICYLVSGLKKMKNGKPVLGECEKVPDRYKWAIDFDFLITIFTSNCAMFDDTQLEALIFHELLHVGVEYMGDDLEKTPIYRYYIVPHDVEDFECILRERGLGWQKVAEEGSDATDMASEAAS